MSKNTKRLTGELSENIRGTKNS